MSEVDLATLEVLNLLNARSFPGPFPWRLARSRATCAKCKDTIEHSPGLCLTIKSIRRYRKKKAA